MSTAKFKSLCRRSMGFNLDQRSTENSLDYMAWFLADMHFELWVLIHLAVRLFKSCPINSICHGGVTGGTFWMNWDGLLGQRMKLNTVFSN